MNEIQAENKAQAEAAGSDVKKTSGATPEETGKPTPKPAAATKASGAVAKKAPGAAAKKAPGGAAPKAQPVPPPRPPANAAVVKPRHRGILHAFYLIVLLPALLTAGYLYFVAEDQYASYMGFSIRTEEANSAIDILGGISQLSGSSGSDADILFEFMQSQRLVRAVDGEVDLRKTYFNADDPVFGLQPESSIEELMTYWDRVVKVFYNSASGLIDVRVTAFRPEDAQRVGQSIYNHSSQMINELSAIARDDTTRYAREELRLAELRLSDAREAVQKFRVRTQIVDPESDLLGRMGVLNSLQEQLATAQIEQDLLLQTAGSNDPRLDQASRRVVVIEDRLIAERRKISLPEDGHAEAYADLVGEYERLAVDLEFAQNTYVAARGALDSALAEALRKSKYLAAYVSPTLAETAEYPKRLVLLATIVGFLLAAWAMGGMIYYSLRDRR